MNILIADDVEINLKLLRAILEAEGHSVIEALDGAKALAALEVHPVDVIISDILMPNMDGFRLCQEVRQSERFGSLPVIIYTATYTSPGDEKLAKDLGADLYLRKPAPAHVLREALAELSSKPQYQAPRNPLINDEKTVMREYNEALVRKLEQKNAELEIAADEILKINADLEERVKLRTSELSAANSELDAFSHSVAHDLRSPIRAIWGYVQLVRKDRELQLNEDAIHALTRVEDLTKKMSSLIDELLKLSQVGRCEIKPQPVDLSEVAKSILEEFRLAQPDRQIEIEVAPGIVVQGDQTLLYTAFENLLSNAWKFTRDTKQPKIEVGRSIVEGAPTIYVTDNGAGFDTQYIGKLFLPFERLHSETDFPGTGLGLNIVQRIVSRHGGTVWAESVPNEKTTFHLRL